MRRCIFIALALFTLSVAPAGATIARYTPDRVQSFTNPGPVGVEEADGLGKYVWFADNVGGGGSLIRGYLPVSSGDTALKTTIQRTYTDPEGEIGDVSGISTSQGASWIFIGDTTYNRVLWYPRVNATLPADQVNYALVGQTPGPLGATSSGTGNGAVRRRRRDDAAQLRPDRRAVARRRQGQLPDRGV